MRTTIAERSLTCTLALGYAAALLLAGCTEQYPGRVEPYVVKSGLWGQYTLSNAWYHENDTASFQAAGTGSLTLSGFGSTFGDEFYSLSLDLRVGRGPGDTISVTLTQNGTFYADRRNNDGSIEERLCFFPDDGNDWCSTFYEGYGFRIHEVDVGGKKVRIDWNSAP